MQSSTNTTKLRRPRQKSMDQADLYTPSMSMIQKAKDGAALRAALDAAAGSVSKDQMRQLREAARQRKMAMQGRR